MKFAIKKQFFCMVLCSTRFLISAHTQPDLFGIQTYSAAQPVGPLSQAMCVQHPNRFLYTSGQLPIDPKTNVLELDDIEKATKLCMQNLLAILCAGNMNFNDVCKTTIFLRDMKDFEVVSRTYQTFLELQCPGRTVFPARTTVQVAALPKNAPVEIEMIAAGK